MRLAAFTDYGLRILMRLTDAPDEAMTTPGIARQFRIPYNHLTKVVQDLAHGCFITTQRGSGDGIRLARPADAITLGEVVRFFEQRYAITECFRANGGACLLTPRCRLKPRLYAAREAFLEELNKTTVAACALPGLEPDKPPSEAARGKQSKHFAECRQAAENASQSIHPILAEIEPWSAAVRVHGTRSTFFQILHTKFLRGLSKKAPFGTLHFLAPCLGAPRDFRHCCVHARLLNAGRASRSHTDVSDSISSCCSSAV